MNTFKILEYGSFVCFVLGALLYLFDHATTGTILLIVAILIRAVWVLKVKKVSDKKEEFKDVIDDNLEEE